MSQHKKWIWIFLLSLGIGVTIVIPFFLPIWDNKTVEDADLLVATSSPLPSPETNAYTYVTKLLPLTANEKKAAEQAENILHGENIKLNKSVVVAESKYIVDSSKRLIPLFLQAAQQNTFHCLKDTCASTVSEYQDIHDLILIHAFYAAKQGDIVRASDLLKAAVHFGFIFGTQENSQGTLITFLVGERMVTDSLDISQLVRISEFMSKEEFEANIYPQDFYATVRKRMYADDKLLLLQSFGKNIQQRYWFLPNKTVNTLAAFAREEIQILGGACTGSIDITRAAALDQKIADIKEGVNLLSSVFPNIRGNMQLSILFAGQSHIVHLKICEHNTRISNMAL